MLSTTALIEAARKLQRDDFLRAYPGHYLLAAVASGENLVFTFRTEPAPEGNERVKTPTRSQFHLFAVAKSPKSPYPDRISVGRAHNCDVVLRDRTVSKLHAHFRLLSNGLAVIDNNSRNGTSVNDSKIAPEMRQRVSSGDRITFGHFEVVLADAAWLFEFLRR